MTETSKSTLEILHVQDDENTYTLTMKINAQGKSITKTRILLKESTPQQTANALHSLASELRAI